MFVLTLAIYLNFRHFHPNQQGGLRRGRPSISNAVTLATSKRVRTSRMGFG